MGAIGGWPVDWRLESNPDVKGDVEMLLRKLVVAAPTSAPFLDWFEAWMLERREDGCLWLVSMHPNGFMLWGVCSFAAEGVYL